MNAGRLARLGPGPTAVAARGSGAPDMLVARELHVIPPGAHEPAVRGASLSVAAGEWIALTGPNGGGKSSLLLAIAGLWPISGGTLELDGVPFAAGSRESGRVAVVLQDPSSQLLQPTVSEELAFTARNLGQPEHEVAAAVRHWSTALGLDDEQAREPATLSAGRQQMVLLAAALVAAPRLLLADEPTAHLDGAGRARVLEVIAEQVRRGLAVVWATQESGECAMATRVIPVGGGAREGGDLAQHIPSPPLEPRLRLRISPASATTDGPRIRITQPLEIRLGDHGILGLMGPNGAGKSALIAAAAGISPSPQVTVEWESKPSHPPIMALQYPELQIFEEDVADELVFAAVSRGMAREEALEAAVGYLRRLGFEPEPMLARRTWALSSGAKRLVEVVGALIAPAGLILLDEPTAGLDPERRAALGAMVAARARAVPVIVASQDREWVRALGAQTVTLNICPPATPSPSRKRD